MKLAEARNLVDSALRDNTAASQTIVRDLCSNYRYRVPAVLARVIFEKSRGYKDYLKDVSRFDSLMRLVNLAVWTDTAKFHIVEIDNLIFVGLQHSSGKVRQNARALSENYARFLGSSDIDGDNQTAPDATEFLYHLERLIKKYEPKNIPMYIDNAAPSIYKSLVLTWHDTIIGHQLWERLNYLERMMDLAIPPYSYQGQGDQVDEDDQASEENDYTREEWKDYLDDFIVCNDWGYARELLDKQENMSISLLKRALEDNGVNQEHCPRILQLARSSKPSQLADVVLMELIHEVWSKYKETRVELVLRTNKIARAIQTMDNNAVVMTSQGHPFSRMISCSAGVESWHKKRRLIDIVPLLECFSASHLAVDEIINELLIPEDNVITEFYKKRSARLSPLTDFATLRQVAHYILDWLIQVNYRLYLRRTPQQMAAVAWHIVDKRNPGLKLQGLESRSLAAFGGWPDSSGLARISQALNNALEQKMADPMVLTITSAITNYF